MRRQTLDLTVSSGPAELGVLGAIENAYVIAVEQFPLDRMLDEDGKRLKDVSHPRSRWLYRSEIERILGVPGSRLGTLDEGDEPAASRGTPARAFFAKLDSDRNGLLTDAEYERAGAAVDRNGDGRITLMEMAETGLAFASPRTQVPGSESAESRFLTTRVTPDGDLARLLDGTNPYEFDRDDDDRLDRREMARALFAALDLDADGRLTRAELSRHPGELRQLRYGDTRALEQFGRRDLNRGGTISPRELKVGEREWNALDADQSGFVQLEVHVHPWWRRRGYVGAKSEWPTRQPLITSLPPVITTERVLEALDRNGDSRLSKRELKHRPDLFREMDRDGDDVVTEREIAYRVAQVAQRGVELTQDGFVARWDLDGSGEVDPDELPDSAWIPLRRDRGAGD